MGFKLAEKTRLNLLKNKVFDRNSLSLWNQGMSASLRSLVIATSQIKDVLRFYESLGLVFKTKKVSLGTEYYWTMANGLEIAFLEKPNLKQDAQPHYMLSFRVKNIDVKYQQFVSNKFIGILDPTDFEEGRKAIILDPDGRSVEIIEAK